VPAKIIFLWTLLVTICFTEAWTDRAPSTKAALRKIQRMTVVRGSMKRGKEVKAVHHAVLKAKEATLQTLASQHIEQDKIPTTMLVTDPAATPAAAPAAAPAATPAPAVVQPVITEASKIRAQMEKVRVTNEQNTRVSTTQEERKTAYVEEISQKKIADAKAKSARVIAEATQDGKNYVANSIAKETQEKKEENDIRSETRAKIKRRFAAIAARTTEVKIETDKQLADVKASLKQKMEQVASKINQEKTEKTTVQTKIFNKWKAGAAARAAAVLNRHRVYVSDMDTVETSNAAEKTFKAGLTRKEAARKQVLLGKHVLRLKIRAYRELKEKDWIKTNGPGAKQVQRLQRRAERHTRDYARRNSRNQRRAVAKSIHKMAQQGRHLSRNIRAVAERAYDDLQKVEKVEENQPVKSHVEKMDRRRRYVSTFEKSLTSVASQFGSAHHAADAAVDDVVHEDHLQP